MNANPQKSRAGLRRLWHAYHYSLSGLQAAWQENAFRLEAICSFGLIPTAFFVGKTWLETSLLIGTVMLVMVVELLNSSIEAAIDRIGPEWHELSKRAKDMGSAAVLLSSLLCAGIWLAAVHAFVSSS